MTYFTICPGIHAARSEWYEEAGTMFLETPENLSPIEGRTEWGQLNSHHQLIKVSIARDKDPTQNHKNDDSSQTLTLRKA